MTTTTTATDTRSAWDVYVESIRLIVEGERRAAEEAEKAKNARGVTVHESYDPGDGSTKKGRTRSFKTMAAAMAAAEKQYFEYKSTLVVVPGGARPYHSVTVDRGVCWISWK